MSRLPLVEPDQLPPFLCTLHDQSGDNTPLLRHRAHLRAGP
jgi:hypothetical protein